MNPIEWLLINWHWAYLLLVIVLAVLLGVVFVCSDWFE